jgi:NADPH:quinone reductase-like Zn-dependent oxidoreductase
MRAFVLQRYGGPSAAKLQEVPQPEPSADEVLVRVHAAGLNPVDYKFRNGLLRVIHRPKLPFVMGNELAGTIVACGSNVKGFASGERVFACCDIARAGAFAEYACVHQNFVAKMPAGLDFESAAAVPLAGLTALQSLRDQLHISKGDRILITGGAGGVGTFAIQISKWLEAFVATTASPRGIPLVQRLGADQVIDYTQKNGEQLGGFDAGLDLVGAQSLPLLFAAVKFGMRVLSIAALPEPKTAADLQGGFGMKALFWLISLPIRWKAWRSRVEYRYYFMHPNGVDLSELAKLIDDGHLQPVVDRTFPFSEIGDAFAYLEQGHAKGKVVVKLV